jgi:2-enoate reductase
LTAGIGRNAGLQSLRQIGAVAPSPIPCFSDPSITARELTKGEVKQLVQAFELAAGLVSDAGVDAIELHGHEGYLFDEFMTALWNKRTDEYGGDLDNRLRFASEVVDAIKRGAGADFPIIYRYGLTHYLEAGRKIEEGLEIARRLEALGVNALHIDAGCYETWYWAHPATTMSPGCLVNLAERVKRVVTIPVITVGKLGYPDLAEKVLQDSKANFIALGRQLLADPEWPNKVKEGNIDDICPCIGCHDCLSRIEQGKYISCVVNPT